MPAVPASDHAGQPVSRLVDLPPCDVEALDAVVLTRIGEDHLDRTAAARVGTGCRLIMPDDDPDTLTEFGFTDMQALAWGQSFTSEKEGEALTLHAVPTTFGGPRRSNGYVAIHTMGDVTQTAYWTGDTRWFSDARQIKELSGRFDVLIPYLGGVSDSGTLDGKDAMQFVFVIQPKRIVPVNYNTFSHYREGIEDFKERIGLTMYDNKLAILEEGATFER